LSWNPKSALRNGPVAIAAALVVIGGMALAHHVMAEGRNSATVSFLEGGATNSTGGTGSPEKLSQSSTVFENDIVQTTDGSKLELKLKDGSVIRVGPASKLQLKSAYFGSDGDKKFSAKLFFGRVWSKVAGLAGSNSTFDVETDNAVAGVRGTTFRVDAAHDKSVLVRVYAGAVAMLGPAAAVATQHKAPTARHQTNGPKQISKDDWEKLVGKMMQMRVEADGTPGDPQAFAMADDSGDDWAAWNEKMDGAK
jgi:hypothetical protein